MGNGTGLSRRRFLALAGGTLAGGAAYACGLEPLWLRTERLEVEIAGLDPLFDGYRIVQLSDLHAGASVPPAFLRRAVDEANALKPDLVVVTGDLVDRSADADAPAEAASILSEAHAPDGVLAVLGNHDMGAYQPEDSADRRAVPRMRAATAEGGVRLLHNEVFVLERGGARVRVAGLGDLWSRRFDPARVTMGDPHTPTIALSHNPDTAPELARHGVDLILSGHTHGGQVALPLFGAPFVPLRTTEYVAGHFRIGTSQLYVNTGLGYSHRVRFGARPEVTLHTLRTA